MESQQELLPPEPELEVVPPVAVTPKDTVTAIVPVEEAVAIVTETHRGAQPIDVGPKAFKYSLPELRKIGEIMYSSGMFKDLRSVQQAMVKLLAGAELGYGPFQSLRAFHVIEGKPVETAGEIAARIKRSKTHDYSHFFIDAGGARWDTISGKNADLHGCVVTIRIKEGRKWFNQEPVRFNMEDARDAGLAGKTNWKNYKRAMLFARTITEAARAHCADLFGGPIYTPEELGADVTIDGSGEMVLTGSSTPPPANGNGEKAPPEVDNEQTRASGAKAVQVYAGRHKIPDEHRHEIAQAFFGKSSTKELNTGELRKLYQLLVHYKQEREKFGDDFADWLDYNVAVSQEAPPPESET